MLLKFYRGEQPNFGDELNPYIFNRLFNFENAFDHSFYGIGSIIDSRIKPNEDCIIFGSGIRDLVIKESTPFWDIRFVRGPISANILKSQYITDSAYCIKLLPNDSIYHNFESKKYKFSYIPYFRDVNNYVVKLVCQILNIHIIDPRNDVDFIISEINYSEYILAGAMHGAIVADILRVPWIRVRNGIHGLESSLVSEVKWHDWLLSLSLNTNNLVSLTNYNSYQNRIKSLSYIYSLPEFIDCYKKFQNLITSSDKFQLSSDSIFLKSIDKLNDEVYKVKMKYPGL